MYKFAGVKTNDNESTIMKPYSGMLLRCAAILLAISLLSSCSNKKETLVIGVSQCSEDSWRKKLVSELKQSTYLYEDIQLVIRSADDDVEQQKQQIQELVDLNVDLLIVSPQHTESLSSAIKKATDRNIPVILFDRKSDVDNYTAFMGADNYSIGAMLAEYVAGQLDGKGCIIEIAGEHGSSPAEERHKGFNDVIAKYPGLKIVGYGEGDWKQISGEKCMEQILAAYGGPIDCVFGANDRIALGARHAIERHKQVHKDWQVMPGKVMYVGVDALPTPGGGIEKVKEGKLTASAIYPTHGDELINLAISILRGGNYDKQNAMETSLVTSDNANVLLLQYKEIVKQDNYIARMHDRVDGVLSELGMERIILWGTVILMIAISTSLIVTIRTLRAKHRLNETLKLKNEELNRRKEIAERQRDELEEQRDQLLDITTRPQTDEETEEVNNATLQNEFLCRFNRCLDERIADSDLSVEDIGREMGLSRVQLYRKVKAVTGKTPVETIREERLKRAKVLVQDTSLSISEIAYRVGFSSPSYFTKCYKDFYGKTPSSKKEA